MGVFAHQQKKRNETKNSELYLRMSVISNQIEDTNVHFPTVRYDEFAVLICSTSQVEAHFLNGAYPVQYYSKEGFVERKIEINEEDLQKII